MPRRSLGQYAERLLKEPPFRLATRWTIERFSSSIRRRAVWDATHRPHYLAGVLAGADEAVREGESAICALEMGVASGGGLVTLESYAAAAAEETGVQIHVFGFDSGEGLPAPEDYRDHADWWTAGDYPMDEKRLRQRLKPTTGLVLGDVAETVPRFVQEIQPAPLGFVAFDLDLYSSTTNALRLFTEPGRSMLRRVPVYFDDLYWDFSHRYAGELLAIEHFNDKNTTVKLDHWRSLRYDRPFPESQWLDHMYQAHDLSAASRGLAIERSPARERWPLDTTPILQFGL